MSNFKQFLVEFSESTTKLTDAAEFKKLKAIDSSYAAKLERAWAGDATHYKRDPAKFADPLFTKMLSQEALKKFSPQLVSHKAEIKKLVDLCNATFKQSAKAPLNPQHKDLWATERFHKR